MSSITLFQQQKKLGGTCVNASFLNFNERCLLHHRKDWLPVKLEVLFSSCGRMSCLSFPISQIGACSWLPWLSIISWPGNLLNDIFHPCQVAPLSEMQSLWAHVSAFHHDSMSSTKLMFVLAVQAAQLTLLPHLHLQIFHCVIVNTASFLLLHHCQWKIISYLISKLSKFLVDHGNNGMPMTFEHCFQSVTSYLSILFCFLFKCFLHGLFDIIYHLLHCFECLDTQQKYFLQQMHAGYVAGFLLG